MNLGAVDHVAMAAAFFAHRDGQDVFTRRMAINIADFFGLTPMGVVRYFERAGFLRPGSVEWFRAHGGITEDHKAQARLGRRPVIAS